MESIPTSLQDDDTSISSTSTLSFSISSLSVPSKSSLTSDGGSHRNPLLLQGLQKTNTVQTDEQVSFEDDDTHMRLLRTAQSTTLLNIKIKQLESEKVLNYLLWVTQLASCSENYTLNTYRLISVISSFLRINRKAFNQNYEMQTVLQALSQRRTDHSKKLSHKLQVLYTHTGGKTFHWNFLFIAKMSSLKLKVEELEHKEERVGYSHALKISQLKQEFSDENRQEQAEMMVQLNQLEQDNGKLRSKVC